jgi:hypothetical protein
MRRLVLVLMLLALGRGLAAGEIGAKLSAYASAGAGVGALVGAAAATVPFMQSHNAYDYYTGAGGGLLAGAGLGFILGVIDVATASDDAPQASLDKLKGLAVAWQPGGMAASYSFTF